MAVLGATGNIFRHASIGKPDATSTPCTNKGYKIRYCPVTNFRTLARDGTLEIHKGAGLISRHHQQVAFPASVQLADHLERRNEQSPPNP
jgi:hypothetical protein